MPKTCPTCGAPIPITKGKRPRVYCSDACRQAAYRAREESDRAALEYTAKNIAALSDQETQESMPWLKAARLAAQYPQWPQEFILRGVLASEYSNVPLEYFEQRYLQEDKAVLENPAFTSTYKDLLEQARQEQWSMK